VTLVAHHTTTSNTGLSARRNEDLEVERPAATDNVPIMLTELPAKGVE
jgi:hypothetical protein